MKVYITEPPKVDGTPDEKINVISEWLSELSVTLNMCLRNLGEENLSEELRRKLEK